MFFLMVSETNLQEHRPALFSHLLLSEKLYPHLLETDQAAGITAQLKASDQMKWVDLMNAVKHKWKKPFFGTNMRLTCEK